MDFEELIKPFFLVEVEGENGASICLGVSEYKSNIMTSREDEGFEGNGYDWQSLAVVYLDEKAPNLKDVIELGSEADTFCVFSSDRIALKKFATGFKELCDNEEEMLKLFMVAELD